MNRWLATFGLAATSFAIVAVGCGSSREAFEERPGGNGAFADVTLDCAGDLKDWQPIGGSGNFEYTRIDLVRQNFQGTNGCNDGRHEIHSKSPFGLTVWGWGSGSLATSAPGSTRGT